ncbi:carbohydrate kinase [Reinekea blandensis]|uniref:Sugar kinase, ribokinase family protein n=1 Tax=Reinekea blandensis MED297 TaxID=314283 RepID=A4BDG4_9GAMM|nr:carbohydrate kinase [Reinekea blandensis]EAR09908.1 Sugar kinase, ribokinase family protein [Reinekea sp. MED297] [Reinekea blandensis MED297]
MKAIESKVLDAIRANPLASQQSLADELGLSRESVAGHIMRLTRKGEILGKGYILPAGQTLVVLGGANVDLTGTSADTFRPGDSNPGGVKQGAGGVGRNIAENLARLGNEVVMVTLVGDDSRGRYLIEQAQEAGIQTQAMVRHSEHATSTYLALNNDQGELVGAIADMAIIEQLTPEWLAERMSLLQSAQTLLVEANLPEATLTWLGEQSLNAPLVADAVSATKAVRLKPLLHRLDLLKVNRSEALTLIDEPASSDLSDEQLILRLLACGVTSVLLSLGERGVRYGDSTQQIELPVPHCDMLSDTGAGDALLAGFVHARHHIESVDTQLQFALLCAAMTLEAPQAVNTRLSATAVLQRLTETTQSSALAESES